jgi:hypothetical protein
MKPLALFLLVLALFAPRAVWAVHISDHEASFAESAEHLHHDGHSHEAISGIPASAQDDHDRLGEDEDNDGYKHQHPPTYLIAFSALPPDETALDTIPAHRPLVQDHVPDGVSIARLELPDRPPRTV